MKEETNSTAHW